MGNGNGGNQIFIPSVPKFAEQLNGAMSTHVRNEKDNKKNSLSFRFEDTGAQRVQLCKR
jgi:hypothetical protein